MKVFPVDKPELLPDSESTSRPFPINFLVLGEPRVVAVVNSWNEQIRECYRNARDCAREAANQIDPKIKQDFLDFERGWLLLARSYESDRRLTAP